MAHESEVCPKKVVLLLTKNHKQTDEKANVPGKLTKDKEAKNI